MHTGNTSESDLLSESYIELMTIIHLDKWDKLECPYCEQEIYYRNFQRVDEPMIPPYNGIDEV